MPVKVMKDPNFTLDELKKYIHYDPLTGNFTRLMQMNGLPPENPIAGCKFITKKKPYYKIMAMRIVFRAHRLAWFYMTGEWPQGEIDHHDGNGLNNKFENLRSTTKTENQRNQRLSDANSSGVTGVTFMKNINKYAAYITVNKKRTHLGVFSSLELAAAARLNAQIANNFHKNHGQKRAR